MRKVVLRHILFVVLLIWISNGAAAFDICAESSEFRINENRDFVSNLQKSVFQVIAISDTSPLIVKSLGTATLIDSNGLLLTAAHIFDVDDGKVLKDLALGKQKLKIRVPVGNNNSAIFDATLPEKFEQTVDIASIEVIDWKNDYGFEPVKIDIRNNPQNMAARILGFLLDQEEPSASAVGTVIRVSKEDGFLKISDLSAYHGYSGSSVINELGMAVGIFSGKAVLGDGEDITWAQIDDADNSVLDATPLNSVASHLSRLGNRHSEELIARLNKSTETIPELYIRNFVKNNRLGAISFAYNFSEYSNLLGIKNRENLRALYNMAQCLLPYERSGDIFDLLITKISENNREWFARESMNYNIERGRELLRRLQQGRNDLLRNDYIAGLNHFQLAERAMEHVPDVDRDYKAYFSLDYYNFATLVENHDLDILGNESSSKILARAIGDSYELLDLKINADIEVDRIERMLNDKSISVSLLYAAAAERLSGDGEKFDAFFAASRAIDLSKESSSKLVSEQIELLNQTVVQRKVAVEIRDTPSSPEDIGLVIGEGEDKVNVEVKRSLLRLDLPRAAIGEAAATVEAVSPAAMERRMIRSLEKIF